MEQAKQRFAASEAEAQRRKDEKAAASAAKKPPRKSADRRGWTEEQKRERLRQQEAAWRDRNREKRREMDRAKERRRRERLHASGEVKPKRAVVLTPEERTARKALQNKRKKARAMLNHPEKVAARRAASKAKSDGILVEQPCVLCGSTTDLEMHHPDYLEPLLVTWLCRAHHRAAHRMLRACEREKENDLFAGVFG